MLIKLHEKIHSIIPIHGISDNGDGTYRVDYISVPTAEQLELVDKAISDFPLDSAKEEKLIETDKAWAVLEKTGWDSGQGFLGLSSSDVAMLNGAFSLAKEAAAIGLPIPSIITIDDAEINFSTIQEMTIFMLRYGAARAEMSKDFAAKRRAIKNALSLESLETL